MDELEQMSAVRMRGPLAQTFDVNASSTAKILLRLQRGSAARVDTVDVRVLKDPITRDDSRR